MQSAHSRRPTVTGPLRTPVYPAAMRVAASLSLLVVLVTAGCGGSTSATSNTMTTVPLPASGTTGASPQTTSSAGPTTSSERKVSTEELEIRLANATVHKIPLGGEEKLIEDECRFRHNEETGPRGASEEHKVFQCSYLFYFPRKGLSRAESGKLTVGYEVDLEGGSHYSAYKNRINGQVVEPQGKCESAPGCFFSGALSK
jgi:hypothetical protein